MAMTFTSAILHELPPTISHPLNANQIMTALRHAQRQGEDSYVLFNGFTVGATFTTRAGIDSMLNGTEPWPGAFSPGFHSHQCRIFKVTAMGSVSELVKA